jgi:protease-4
MVSVFNLRSLGSLLLWGIAPLVIGLWLAQWLFPQPAVGIIRLQDDIWLGSAELVRAQIQEARDDPSIKAVVLQLDSPGGEVVAGQTIYLELQNLRREMPVVGSIDSLAASGGYWVALATEPIYAKPSSSIGNVGAFTFIPLELPVNDLILTSGPFKLSASTREHVLREVEGIKQEYLATILSQRGERLNATPAELSQGLVYPGREALRLGLIDHLGSRTEAIATAAEQAGIDHYQVIDLQERALERLLPDEGDQARAGERNIWVGAADPVTGERTLSPGIYLLYNVRLGKTP